MMKRQYRDFVCYRWIWHGEHKLFAIFFHSIQCSRMGTGTFLSSFEVKYRFDLFFVANPHQVYEFNRPEYESTNLVNLLD